MRRIFHTFVFDFIVLFTVGAIAGCALNIFNAKPEFTGVDPKLQGYILEYKKLAKTQGIDFENDITIGFKKINKGTIIGLTTYGGDFREIAIDELFWSVSSSLQKTALLYHELTHALCTRSHDYTKGKEYPATEEDRLKQATSWTKPGEAIPGYYYDGCPLTFMYPTILDDYCIKTYYNNYIKEMFERCSPW